MTDLARSFTNTLVVLPCPQAVGQDSRSPDHQHRQGGARDVLHHSRQRARVLIGSTEGARGPCKHVRTAQLTALETVRCQRRHNGRATGGSGRTDTGRDSGGVGSFLDDLSKGWRHAQPFLSV